MGLRRRVAAAALVTAALLAARPAAANDGEWDYSFGILGRTELPGIFPDQDSYLQVLARQPDGKILVFGTTEGSQTVYSWRLEKDGRVDLDHAFDDYWPGDIVDPIGAASVRAGHTGARARGRS